MILPAFASVWSSLSRFGWRIVWITYCLFPIILWGQEGTVPLRSLTGENGLSESTNLFIHRAQDGQMYIGSMDGTNVFDGQQVQTYRENSSLGSPHHYLGQSNQSPFFETKAGAIWFTTDKGIVCKNGQSGFFHAYQVDSTQERAMHYAFALEQDRYLWVVFNKQTYRLDTQHPASIADSQPTLDLGLIRGTVQLDDNEAVTEIWGSFWQSPGIVRAKIDPQGKVLPQIDSFLVTPAKEKMPYVMKWLRDQDGTLFAITTGGLMVIPQGRFEQVRLHPFSPEIGLVYDFDFHQAGEVWIIGGRGIAAYSAKRGMRVLTEAETGIATEHAWGDLIYFDRRKSGHAEMIWIGQRNYGLRYGNLAANRISNYLPEPAESVTFPQDLFAGEQGDLFIKQRGEWAIYNEEGKIRQQLPGYKFLFGTPVQPLATKTNQPTSIWPLGNSGNRQSLKIDSIPRGIEQQAQLNNGDFLLASKRAIYHFNPAHGEWTVQQKIAQDYFYDICAVGESYLAVASMDGSVKLYALESTADSDQQWVKSLVFSTSGLGPISDLAYDKQRNLLWISSSAGLFSLCPQEHQLKHYTLADGLISDNLRAILIANDGVLWLSGTNGIFNFSPDQSWSGPRFHFTRADGLSANEYLMGVAIQTSDGRLCFGSSKGLDVFHPADLREVNPPTQAQISQLSVHDKPWTGPKNIRKTDNLSLSYRQNSLSFTLAAHEFWQPDNSRFRFFIQADGGQIDTTELGVDNKITLPNLPAASYRFGVAAAAMGAPWVKDQAQWLAVDIHPHWTNTTWFRLVLFFLALAIVSLITAFRYRYQLRVQEAEAAEERRKADLREAQLQRKIDLENQRRQITSRMHNDIGGSLTTLSMLSSRLRRTTNLEKSHQVSEKITHWVRDVRRRFGSFLRIMNPQFDTLEKSVLILRTYAAEFLTDNDIQVNFKLPDSYPDILLVPDFSMALLEITQEILNNVLKYAAADTVEMQVELAGADIIFVFTDNGRGFAPSEEDFEKGIGLSSLQEITHRFAGSIRYLPAAPKGTQVVIKMEIQERDQ